jgi:tetratricopeptide (TPR) repeat protein
LSDSERQSEQGVDLVAAAHGLFAKAFELDRSGRQAEALAIWDELVERFGDSGCPEIRERVAGAFMNKAIALNELDRAEQAVDAYARLDAWFGGAGETVLVARLVAGGLGNRALVLNRLGRQDEAIETYDLLAARFRDSTVQDIRLQLAKALSNKAVILTELDRHTEALTVWKELDTRFGGDHEPVYIKTQVTAGLLNRMLALGTLNRRSEQIQACDELAARHDSSTNPKTREAVAKALYTKGSALAALERDQEAIAVYELLDDRFGGVGEPVGIMDAAARGLINRGRALERLDRHREAIKTYDVVVERYREVDAPEIRAQRATASSNTIAALRRVQEGVRGTAPTSGGDFKMEVPLWLEASVRTMLERSGGHLTGTDALQLLEQSRERPITRFLLNTLVKVGTRLRKRS